MTAFTERYNTYSNAQLLKILERPGEYQPLAVATAKEILKERQLSEEDLSAAKAELETEARIKEAQLLKKKEVREKLKKAGASLADTLNPVADEKPAAHKTITIISIGLTGLFLYQLAGVGDFLPSGIYAKWDLKVVAIFLPSLVLLVTIPLFYKRKKAGWILLAAYLCVSFLGAVWLVYLALTWQPSAIPALDALFPPPSVSTSIFSLLFYGVPLLGICRMNIRELYHVDKKTMVNTFVFVIAGIVLIYLLM